jgi:hypothetical protein
MSCGHHYAEPLKPVHRVLVMSTNPVLILAAYARGLLFPVCLNPLFSAVAIDGSRFGQCNFSLNDPLCC